MPSVPRALPLTNRPMTDHPDLPGNTSDAARQTGLRRGHGRTMLMALRQVVDGLPGAMALVKVVDSSGRLLAADARSLFGMKELQTVYVRGTASKDENGNLVVLATAVYVKK